MNSSTPAGLRWDVDQTNPAISRPFPRNAASQASALTAGSLQNDTLVSNLGYTVYVCSAEGRFGPFPFFDREPIHSPSHGEEESVGKQGGIFPEATTD